MKPTIGRIVNYKHTSIEVLAGLIIAINQDGTVALQLFRLDDNYQNKSVTMAAGPREAAPGQWWWPDRL